MQYNTSRFHLFPGARIIEPDDKSQCHRWSIRHDYSRIRPELRFQGPFHSCELGHLGRQMGSTRMGPTIYLDFRTWTQRTHATQEEQLKQKVPVGTTYNSICRTSFWWVSAVANLVVTWYFQPARSSTNAVECHHTISSMIDSEPLCPFTPHMISCLNMTETRFVATNGILLHLTTQRGKHPLHPTFRLSIVHCATLAAFTAPQGITSENKHQPYMFGYAALS